MYRRTSTPRRRTVAATAVAAVALLAGAACSRPDRVGDDDSLNASAAADSGAPRAQGPARAANAATGATCLPDNGGITLPDGFCASVFADRVGGARHVAVAPNGDVFVALQTAPDEPEAGKAPAGGILALRDTTGDGRADVTETFGDLGGTGVALHGGYLYAEGQRSIVRYPLPAGSLRPSGKAETIVSGLAKGGHEAHNFVIDGNTLYVNFGSETNSCQVRDRQRESPGHDPCTELERRAGVWRFDANKPGQTVADGHRFATGIRNAVGLAVSPADGALYATQHGRDQLYQNWPKLYTQAQSAEQPQEQLMRLSEGDDYGWPYCYFDGQLERLVLAPEYGGNGREVGRCAQKTAPLAHYPGHWAPTALAFYDAAQFPERYRGGAFIAFHGSWNRAPEPQAGYNVVFQPMANGQPSGQYETFADGFAGATKQPERAAHRPTGLAVGPDGALFITDDAHGRIWRVVYRGR